MTVACFYRRTQNNYIRRVEEGLSLKEEEISVEAARKMGALLACALLVTTVGGVSFVATIVNQNDLTTQLLVYTILGAGILGTGAVFYTLDQMQLDEDSVTAALVKGISLKREVAVKSLALISGSSLVASLGGLSFIASHIMKSDIRIRILAVVTWNLGMAGIAKFGNEDYRDIDWAKIEYFENEKRVL